MAVTLIRDMKCIQARIGIGRDARPPPCPTPQGDSEIGSLTADGADITDGIDGAGRRRSSKRVAASRESAAHFSRRDTRIESLSRNPFFPPIRVSSHEVALCSVVRIGRSRRGWADTAHTTEDNQRNGEGPEFRQQY